MNASTPAVSIPAALLRTTAAVATAFTFSGLQADAYVPAPPLTVTASIAPGSAGPAQRSPLDGGMRLGRNTESGAGRQAEAAKSKGSAAADRYSPLKYAYFCFGPIFGNDSRGIDPNFMPSPAATDGSSENRPAIVPVRYTRTPTTESEKTTWVGSDGSRVSYVSKLSGRADRVAEVEASNEKPLSVEDLITENRKELTKISWTRAYRRFPELGKDDSPERTAFGAYLATKQANSQDASVFENPMWPELLSAEFMEAWNWKKAEEESWERVRANVRVFNNRDSAYTRRFLAFAEDLRADPEGAAIFKEPTWPEKALELHDQKLGAVPQQLR